MTLCLFFSTFTPFSLSILRYTYQLLKCIPLTTAYSENCHILQKAGNSPVISPNLLPACLYYLSNFSAATSKNFTLDQAVPPCANGSIALTKT